MKRVHIQPVAAIDIEETAIWYETQEPGLGIEFILELDAAIDLAVEGPENYEDLGLGIRRVLLQRFPYAVYFLLEKKAVEIIAVLHQHRSPFIWQSRI